MFAAGEALRSYELPEPLMVVARLIPDLTRTEDFLAWA
jgi:hypothetical protein